MRHGHVMGLDSRTAVSRDRTWYWHWSYNWMKRPGLDKVLQVSISIFCICMCRHECVCTHVSACMCMAMWKAEVKLGVIPQEQHTLFSETGFLTNLEFMALIGWLDRDPHNPSASAFPVLALQPFYGCWGSNLGSQALHMPSHLWPQCQHLDSSVLLVTLILWRSDRFSAWLISVAGKHCLLKCTLW